MKDETYICRVKECNKEVRVKSISRRLSRLKLCPQCYTKKITNQINVDSIKYYEAEYSKEEDDRGPLTTYFAIKDEDGYKVEVAVNGKLLGYGDWSFTIINVKLHGSEIRYDQLPSEVKSIFEKNKFA